MLTISATLMVRLLDMRLASPTLKLETELLSVLSHVQFLIQRFLSLLWAAMES